MMKRTFALIALLTFFSPFLAAQGQFTIVTEVKGIVYAPPSVFLTVAVTPIQDIDIRVDGLDLTGITAGVQAQVVGIFTETGPRATALVIAGELLAKDLTGKIVGIDEGKREVTLQGGWVILVPEGALLKDEFGTTRLLGDFVPGVDFVKATGEVLAGWFTASELKIVEEFVCPGGAALTHFSDREPELFEDHEDFCVQNKGGRQGRTRIRTTDFGPEGALATITVGRYTQNQRQGLWVTLSEAGEVRYECLYHLDELVVELFVDGDETCEFTPLP